MSSSSSSSSSGANAMEDFVRKHLADFLGHVEPSIATALAHVRAEQPLLAEMAAQTEKQLGLIKLGIPLAPFAELSKLLTMAHTAQLQLAGADANAPPLPQEKLDRGLLPKANALTGERLQAIINEAIHALQSIPPPLLDTIASYLTLFGNASHLLAAKAVVPPTAAP